MKRFKLWFCALMVVLAVGFGNVTDVMAQNCPCGISCSCDNCNCGSAVAACSVPCASFPDCSCGRAGAVMVMSYGDGACGDRHRLHLPGRPVERVLRVQPARRIAARVWHARPGFVFRRGCR